MWVGGPWDPAHDICPIMPYLALSCPIMPYLALSCPILPYLALSCPIMPYHACPVCLLVNVCVCVELLSLRQPLGTDQKTLMSILAAANKQLGYSRMITVSGFTPWVRAEPERPSCGPNPPRTPPAPAPLLIPYVNCMWFVRDEVALCLRLCSRCSLPREW
jgi:hypothetical protein